MESSRVMSTLDTALPRHPSAAGALAARSADSDGPASHVMRFIARCGAPALDPAAHQALRALGQRLDASEWRLLLARSREQGMASLVFLHATQAGALVAAPAAVVADLAASYAQTLVTGRQLERAQDEVLTAFTGRGIQVIVLKGTSLAERYYGTIALRPVRDIDLLVHRADLSAAADTLKHLGFTAQQGLGSPTRFFALASSALGYQRAGRVTVEVHWQLTSRPVYRPALAVRRAWARALPLDDAASSGKAFRLAPADELRFLCVHLAAEHEMSRLIWLVDIAALVRSLGGDWDWEGFTAETICGGAATPVAVALHHAAELLDLDVPPDILRRLTDAADTPRERHIWQVARAQPFSGAWMWSRLAALERPLDLAVLLRGMLVPRPSTLASLGFRAAPARRLPIAYARHWRRRALEVFRAAIASRRAAGRRGG